MPTRITKYKTVDGLEHETWDAAYAHEQALKLVRDVNTAIIEHINGYKDDQQRRVYNPDPVSIHAFADMIVTTDLLAILNRITKGKIKQ